MAIIMVGSVRALIVVIDCYLFAKIRYCDAFPLCSKDCAHPSPLNSKMCININIGYTQGPGDICVRQT
jgi:hypothetical protein